MTESNRYTTLLQQIAALQENLSKTTAICHSLKSQNETLMQSHEQLRTGNDRLSREIHETEENYLNVQNSKAESEKKSENVISDLRQQFERQSVDFANLQADLARRGPQDLQIVRMQILEDLSSKFREKVATAEAESEKFRDLYYTHKRSQNLLSEEKNRLIENHKREIKNREKSHKAALQRLDATLREAQNSTSSSLPGSGQVISLERKVSELEATHKELIQEVTDVRKEKEDVIVAMNESALLTARQIADLKAELLRSQCEQERSQSKHNAQVTSINALHKRLEETRLRLSDTEQQLQSQTLLTDQLTQENTHLKDDHSAMLMQIQSQYEQRVRAIDVKLKEEKLGAERILTQKNKEIEDLNRQLSRVRHENERAMQSVHERLQQLQKNKSLIEKRLREAHEENQELNDSGQRVLDAAHARLDVKIGELDHSTKACSKFEQRIHGFQTENKNLKQKLKELDANFKTLQDDHGKAKLELQSAASQRQRLEVEIERFRATEALATDTQKRNKRELQQEKEMFSLHLRKKEASLNSEIQQARKSAQEAQENANLMKARCQHALAKAKDKYKRLKLRFEAEANVRVVAEEAVAKLRNEYEKLQRSNNIRNIEKVKDHEFNDLALAKLSDRLSSPHKDLLRQLKSHSNELAALSIA